MAVLKRSRLELRKLDQTLGFERIAQMNRAADEGMAAHGAI
jgi:hypothetical protein